MGFMDFLKGVFGKQVCAFCGQEIGPLKRTKIKNKEFICNNCGCNCSRFIQKYRYTKDELLGHMEYMKRQDRLYNEILGNPTWVIPSTLRKQAIEFFDNDGMFRIRDWDYDNRYKKELIRYDQVAKYEAYCDESEPDEPGKEKVFGECGVKITLVGAADDTDNRKQGLRPHPYITDEITVCVDDRNKEEGMREVQNIVAHFDFIFGVHDDTKGLFDFGPTRQQKREREAMKAMGGMFGAAIKAAKTGEVSADAVAKAQDAMNKVDDAATSGLAEYSRRADAAEAKI